MNGSIVRLFIGQRLTPQNEVPAPAWECAEPARVPRGEPGVSTVAERVQRGAELLDSKRPGWWRQIDLDRLDIDSGCDCIAGQLGPFMSYLSNLRLMGLEEQDDIVAAGFEADDRHRGMEEIEAEYDALTAAWRDLITGRRLIADAGHRIRLEDHQQGGLPCT